MTPACDAFRREFVPGRRGPHTEACAGCRAWAEEVEAWRSLGAPSTLPTALRARLLAIPGREVAGDGPLPDPAGPLSLPPTLRARLLKIPAAERSRRRVLKARYAVAASYLLAGLLTLATGGGAQAGPAGERLTRASARGTAFLQEASGWIAERCLRADQTLETLFGRLAARPAGGPEKAAPTPHKEDPDGTRQDP